MKGNKTTKCKLINQELNIIPQHIIYYFNNLDVRNHVIESHITKYKKHDKFCNFGTINMKNINDGQIVLSNDCDIKTWKKFNSKKKKSYYHNKDINEFFSEMRHVFVLKPKTIFTVCLHYNQQSVHFVSFIYDRKTKDLISFDPGVHVYPEGQKIIVPTIKNALQNTNLLKTNTELGSTCYQHRYIFPNEPIGIQYNFYTKDAFCQNWSLYFLVEQIKCHNIVRKVCRMHPANREIHLFKDFIIPILYQNKKFVRDIAMSVFIESNILYSVEDILNKLDLYIKYCKSTICENNKSNNTSTNIDSDSPVCLVNILLPKK